MESNGTPSLYLPKLISQRIQDGKMGGSLFQFGRKKDEAVSMPPLFQRLPFLQNPPFFKRSPLLQRTKTIRTLRQWALANVQLVITHISQALQKFLSGKFIAAAALMLRLPFALASLNYAWLKTFLVVLQSGSARESERPLGAVTAVRENKAAADHIKSALANLHDDLKVRRGDTVVVGAAERMKNALETLHEDLATREDHPPNNIKNALETLHEDLATRDGPIVLGGVAERMKNALEMLHEDMATREDRPALAGINTALETLHEDLTARGAPTPLEGAANNIKTALADFHKAKQPGRKSESENPPNNIKTALVSLHEDLADLHNATQGAGDADRSAVVDAKSFLATLHEDLTAGREDRPAVVGVKTALATLHAEREGVRTALAMLHGDLADLQTLKQEQREAAREDVKVLGGGLKGPLANLNMKRMAGERLFCSLLLSSLPFTLPSRLFCVWYLP
ncbi:hypothetical protein DFH08DRAFT_956107 [Mycena albidolilacea]|uniref:Uncharacterized protein n=1 Tax=Mycena albidolilacea TaxID=1033008 RepID=A0AAD7A9Q8_9AGAR|nr:hypothetical protein DFH08DRAFT_956107 [Mycena albidolilacea]